MATVDVQSPLKPKQRSLFVRAAAYTIAVVLYILVGFIAVSIPPKEQGKLVLGAQTSSDPLSSELSMLLNVNPKVPTQVIYNTIQATPTPTPQTNHWPTFSTSTPTPQPSQWPHPATPTPTVQPNQWPNPITSTPTPQPNQWPTFVTSTPTPMQNQWPHPSSLTPTPQLSQSPTPSPTNAPLAPSKLKQIVSNAGITLINPKITTDLSSKNIIINGDSQDKLFGIIPVSFPVSIKVNQINGVVVPVSKPWWQKLLTNPFTKVTCSNSLSESSCIKNGCEYWSDCNKCQDFTTPYDPTCTCDSIKDKNTCNGGGCEWHSDKSICTIPCKDITDKNYCANYLGCRYYDTCGKCGDSNSPPSTSCKCTSNKNPTTCGAATDCQWHPECISGGGACADKGVDSIKACGETCDNIAGQQACTDTGCTYYPRCGLCHSYPPPDSCLCHVIKNQTTCDSATGCQWHPECTGGLNCIVKGASSLDACGDCMNINSKDACNNSGKCHYYDTCGKCGAIDDPPDPSCSCAALKGSDECAVGWNCKWHPECGGGGVCASQLGSYNPAIICGGCKNIVDKSACSKAPGCTYSNGQCL